MGGGGAAGSGDLCPIGLGAPVDPGIAFTTATEHPTRRGAEYVALGDLNGDGKPDLAVINAFAADQNGAAGSNGGGGTGNTGGAGPNFGTGSVSVFLSQGNAGFAGPQNYLAGNQPNFIAIGDLDGDGKSDLAITNFQDLSILYNDGAGTLLSPVSFSTGSQPTWVAISDLNGDGKADLAVANEQGGGLAILLNLGNGSFVSASYPAGSAPGSGALGDLNGDGKPDIAVVNKAGVGVLLNNGDGTFAPIVGYGAGTFPSTVAIGDLNGDGRADLAVSNGNVGGASVLLNIGSGTFAAPVDYAYAGGGGPVAIGDLNGDGKPDLISSGSGPCGVVAVLLNRGSAAFNAPFYMNVGQNPTTSFALGDLNADGRLDLVVTDYNINGVVSEPQTLGVGVLLNGAH